MMQNLVIVRGFEGEPVRMVVVGTDGNRVTVAHPTMLEKIAAGESFPVSLPLSDVYRFDSDLFERLLREWRGSSGTSPTTWEALSHWRG